MSSIWQRIKEEPAVAIGLLISIGLLIVALLTDTKWDATTILFIVGPFVSALGIRPAVKPTAKIERENKEEALTNLQRP